MCDEAELTLESTPLAIRTGRRFTAETLARWGFDDDGPAGARAGEIVLVTSELLTNAVRASSGNTGLHIVGHRDHVLVEVRDESPAPAVARAASSADTGGRGLAIVQALSTRWGSSPSQPTGKVVWSKLAVPPRPALAEHCRL